MKHIFLLLTFTILLFSFESFSQERAVQNLYGKWIAIAPAEEGYFSIELHNDGKLTCVLDGQTMTGTYKVDFNKKPIWFDITTIVNGRKSVGMGILKFMDNDTIVWEPMYDNKRKTSFSEKYSEAGIFRRAK